MDEILEAISKELREQKLSSECTTIDGSSAGYNLIFGGEAEILSAISEVLPQFLSKTWREGYSANSANRAMSYSGGDKFTNPYEGAPHEDR